MSKILRRSHLNILNNLPDFVRREYVFSGGTALAEYYFQHRLSDDLDFFCLQADCTISVDALFSSMQKIGPTQYEKTHGRVIFSTESCGEIIKSDFCPLYFKRLNPPVLGSRGYLVDSIEDIAANKLLALCGRNEPKDFIDVYFFYKIAGYNVPTMIALAERKALQAYKYLINLDRAEKIVFDRHVYKMIAEFDETELKDYFRQQNQLIKQSSVVLLDDDEVDTR